MAKHFPIVLGASAAVAALAFLLWPDSNARQQTALAHTSPVATEATTSPGAETKAASENQPQWSSDEERDAFFIADMQGRFAPHIHIQHAQIRFLEQLISYLRQHYPDDWRSRVAALLNASFPDLATELQNKFDALERYNEWLLADRKQLQAMPAGERRAALWDKRYAAFGDDAEVIWAAEIRNQKISDTLLSLDDHTDSSVQEKLTTLVTAIEQNYGQHADDFIKSRQTELLNKFVEIPSVQTSLNAMPANERRSEMRAIRQTLGMDEAALDRWEKLDTQRDQTWSAGQNYMQQREQIVARYDGNRQQRELEALQKSVFGEQAEMIQREEAAGFFRYARQRRIGRE